MRTGSEGRTGINVKSQSRLAIRFRRLFPRRDDQNIINPELMEKLLPVIHPVDVLGLFNGNGPISDGIRILTELTDHILHFAANFLRRLLSVLQEKLPVFGLLHIKAQNSTPVISRLFRHNIHKHLLLFRCRQRNMILDLGTAQTDVLHGADQNILRIRCCTNPKPHPLHKYTSHNDKCRIPEPEEKP